MPSDHEIMKAQWYCKNGIRTKIGHGSYREPGNPPLERRKFCLLVLYGRSLVGRSVKFSDLVILMDSGLLRVLISFGVIKLAAKRTTKS